MALGRVRQGAEYRDVELRQALDAHLLFLPCVVFNHLGARISSEIIACHTNVNLSINNRLFLMQLFLSSETYGIGAPAGKKGDSLINNFASKLQCFQILRSYSLSIVKLEPATILT